MKNEFNEVMLNIEIFYKEKLHDEHNEHNEHNGDERLLRIYEGEYTKQRI